MKKHAFQNLEYYRTLKIKNRGTVQHGLLIASGYGTIMTMKPKNKSAVLLGSLGGKARAKKLTKEQLSVIGKKGGRPLKQDSAKIIIT